MVFMDEPTWKGLDEAVVERFSGTNKLKEKIIHFCSTSFNYNNRLPADSNDSQNGIHCCQQAAIIYELT